VCEGPAGRGGVSTSLAGGKGTCSHIPLPERGSSTNKVVGGADLTNSYHHEA
ncbi:Protein dispatched like 1, partial [Dissostichus eleginoides]